MSCAANTRMRSCLGNFAALLVVGAAPAASADDKPALPAGRLKVQIGLGSLLGVGENVDFHVSQMSFGISIEMRSGHAVLTP